MTIQRIIIPAIARAAEMVLVTAAVVLKIADIVSMAMKLNRKKIKNCDGSVRSPERKYRMTLKTVVTQSFIGRSETMPAMASVKGW